MLNVKFTPEETTILKEALNKLEQSLKREATAKPMFREIVEKQLVFVNAVRAKLTAE